MCTSLIEYFTEWVLHWMSTSLNEYFTEWVLHISSEALTLQHATVWNEKLWNHPSLATCEVFFFSVTSHFTCKIKFIRFAVMETRVTWKLVRRHFVGIFSVCCFLCEFFSALLSVQMLRVFNAKHLTKRCYIYVIAKFFSFHSNISWWWIFLSFYQKRSYSCLIPISIPLS